MHCLQIYNKTLFSNNFDETDVKSLQNLFTALELIYEEKMRFITANFFDFKMIDFSDNNYLNKKYFVLDKNNNVAIKEMKNFHMDDFVFHKGIKFCLFFDILEQGEYALRALSCINPKYFYFLPEQMKQNLKKTLEIIKTDHKNNKMFTDSFNTLSPEQQKITAHHFISANSYQELVNTKQQIAVIDKLINKDNYKLFEYIKDDLFEECPFNYTKPSRM